MTSPIISPLERREDGWYLPDGRRFDFEIRCALCKATMVEVRPVTCSMGRKGHHPTTGHPHVRCPNGHGVGACILPPASVLRQ